MSGDCVPVVSPVVTPPVVPCVTWISTASFWSLENTLAAGDGAEAPGTVGQPQVRQMALVTPSRWVDGLSYQLTYEGDVVQWVKDKNPGWLEGKMEAGR